MRAVRFRRSRRRVLWPPVGVGLVLFAMGTRLIAASEVALIILLEVVLGPFWAWVAVSETPSLMTMVGGAVVVCAVILQATAKPALRKRPQASTL